MRRCSRTIAPTLVVLVLVSALLNHYTAHAQQVVANGTTQIASGTINTGVLTPPAGYGLFALNNGIINSFSPLSVTTGGSASDAAHAQSAGSITPFSGSSVSTTGGGAVGLLATGINSFVDATDITVLTTGNNSFGVEALQGGTVSLAGGSVMTSGSMAWGLFSSDADSTIKATNVTINTTGGAGYGARGIASGHIVLDGGSITTAGSGADALITIASTATIEVTDTIIHTSGPSASGANAFFGSMTLDNVAVTTDGNDSHGARVDNAGALAVTGGSFITSGTSSFGLLSAAGSTLTATNARVETSGASGIGASAQFGSHLTLNGGTITTSGASAAGLFSVGLLTTTTTALSATPVLLDDAATPTAGPTGASITANGVTVRTSGSGSHGASIRGGSSLEMNNSTLTVSGVGAAALFSSAYDAGASIALISNSTLNSAQGAGIRTSGTTLNATFLGSSLAGNPDLLEVVGNGTLNLIASSSTLTGAAVTDAGSTSNVTLQNATTWKMTGNSNVSNLTNDSGLIQFSPPTGDPAMQASYKTLTTQNYTGLGGTLGLNTFLGTDGSPSDKLIINGGAATGDSFLHVTKTGGLGVPTVANGILVVEAINGGVTAPGTFALANIVAAGPFEYRLFRGGESGSAPNDWFLRDEFVTPQAPPTPPEPPAPPTPTPPTPLPPNPFPPSPPPDPLPPNTTFPIIGPQLATYGVVQPLARQMGLAALGTLHERIGDTYQPDCSAASAAPEATGVDLPTRKSVPTKKAAAAPCPLFAPSAWGRFFGETIDDRYRAFADPRANGGLWGFQGGLDLLRGSLISGHTDRAGLYGAYGASNANVDGLVTNPAATAYVLTRTGSLNLDAWSGGAYWTHVGPRGWYLDGVVQGTAYSGHASTSESNLPTDGWGFLASLEAGYPIPFAFGPGFVLEPQAQVIWQHVSFDQKNDGLETIGLGATSGATGRIGLRAQSTFVAYGQVWQPYVRANLWESFGPQAATSFSGSPDQVALLDRATWLELAGGGTVKLRGGWSAYGQLGYQFALAPENVRRNGVSGDFGIRYSW